MNAVERAKDEAEVVGGLMGSLNDTQWALLARLTSLAITPTTRMEKRLLLQVLYQNYHPAENTG